MNIRIGTRPSRLAITQAEEIIKQFPGINFEIIPIETKGDKDKITPLAGRETTDFFTGEIEQALIRKDIDIAVHSAKDLELSTPRELVNAAITRSISPFECLVSTGNLKLRELPHGSIVGTSSRKRKLAIARFRKDLTIRDIRGDIDERLAELDKGKFDAIIAAHAALLRLGYESRIAEIISPRIIEPHPLQGKLAIQARGDRKDIMDIFRGINEN